MAINHSILDNSASLAKRLAPSGVGRVEIAPRARFARLRKLVRHEWIITAGLVGLDVGVWVGVYGSVSFLRGDEFYISPLQFVLIAALQLSIIVAAIGIVGGYNRYTEMRGLPYATEHALTIICAAALSALMTYAAATFDQTMKPSRIAFLASFALFLALSLSYRRFIWRFVTASTANRAFLVVGGGPLAAEFYRAYKASVNRQRLEFVAIDPKRVGSSIAGPGSPIIEGDLETKLERLDQSYSGVVVAERIDRLQPELLERLVRTQFQNVRVYTLESFHEAHWRHVDPFWPLQRGFQLARNSPFHYLKKTFDVLFAALLLVVCAPFLGLIVLAIWWDSGKPAIFRQTRVGRDNEPFTAFKFRTMWARSAAGLTVNDSDLSGPEEVEGQIAEDSTFNHERITNNPTSAPGSDDDIYTRRDDPRVTRVGRWLRKLRLDELPQLINVFRGEMSLIGPRAEWIECAQRYEKNIPFYHFRHLVKPGITGWAQVNYPYGESEKDAIEKLKYDLYYIRNYSLKLDLMIVLKTVYTVLFGKGQ